MSLLRADRVPIAVDRRLARERVAANIPYVAQTETNWCWAACGEMLMRPRGINETQCTLASKQFQLACCPSPGAPRGCDNVAWPDLAYPPRGLPCEPVDGQMPEPRLVAELANGQPVQVCYQWSGSGSKHVALIVDRLADGRYAVLDPDRHVGHASYRFEDIQSAHGQGCWIMTFTF